MDFTGFLGNDAIKRRLSGAFASGRVAHSYLLCGPAGSGKHTLARILCAAMECEKDGAAVPCGVCPGCRKALAGIHPDVITVDDPDHKAMTVDPIRAARSDMFIRPNEGRRKIYVIPRGQDMNESAQNALLKILEEPPDYGAFLILSTNAERLLPTIISRTQEVAVPRIAPDVLERVARERGIADPVKARNMARLAGGDLLELKHLVAGESDALRKENFDLFCGLMRLSYNDKHLELVAWAEDAAQLSREQQRAFLRDAARLLRESYMLHAGIGEVCYLWGEELAFCTKFAPFIGSQNIEPLIGEIESALAQISQNGNPTIVFTHFALAVCKMIKRL